LWNKRLFFKMAKLLIGKTAKGIIKEWYSSTPNSGKFSSDVFATNSFKAGYGVNLKELEELMNDPIVNNAVRTTANAVLLNGWDIFDAVSGDKAPRVTTRFRRMGFSRILEGVVSQALIYNVAMTELVRDRSSGLVKELFLMETPEVRIITDEEGHGEIKKFVQNHNGIAFASWNPDEVWMFVNTKFDTSLTGFPNAKSILHLVRTKRIIEDYILYLFKNNKFAKSWVINNGTTQQVELLVEGLRARQKDPNKEMVVQGDVSVLTQYTPEDIPRLMAYLDYIVSQIRQLLLLPPIVSGEAGSANRSNAETQFRGIFGMNISAFRQKLEDSINYDLFPKMGINGYVFKFRPSDKLDERDAIQNAIYLKGLGFSNSSIKKYLLSKGLTILESAKFVQTPDSSKIVNHEVQNHKSVSRMPTPDNITNFQDKQTPVNSKKANTPIRTTQK